MHILLFVYQQISLQEYELTKLKLDNELLLIHRWLLLVVIFVIILIGMFCFLRFKKYKEQLLQELQHVNKKNKEKEYSLHRQLELEKKALTTISLKLVEKKNFIQSIRKKITRNSSLKSNSIIKEILKEIEEESDDSWEEFIQQFSQVSDDFYGKLASAYPELNEREKKLCAFIKLNIPVKKASSLMGISIESYHSARYRLRKKIGLKKEMNLKELIDNI